MSPSSTLFLFTSYYPFGNSAEAAFLKNELPCLQKKFDEIILVPRYLTGAPGPLPGSLKLDATLAEISDALGSNKRLLGLPWRYILYELITTQRSYPTERLRQIFWSAAHASAVSAWFDRWVNSGRIHIESSLFYTYWLGETTLGLALIKQKQPGMKLISRAHRVDLYEERRKSGYIPGRRLTLRMLDRLYLISNHGREYLKSRYPEFSDRYALSRLGVRDPGFAGLASSDGMFRLVSCSSITPVKRLDRLALALHILAGRLPARSFQWSHFGDGELRTDLARMMENGPANLSVRFFGNVPNDRVLGFYRENPVDLFVNVSDSEGLPVSIMEAQSCGIPVLATAVGGSPEIVTPANGWLVSSASTPEDLADAILAALQDPQIGAGKRRESIAAWRAACSADVNFTSFAAQVSSI